MRCKIWVLFLSLFFLGIYLPYSDVIAQEQDNSAIVKKVTPADIEFTYQMHRSSKDLKWSRTYFSSYQMTGEVSYLNLAAQFCMKSINRLADTQRQLSRTTRFYNQADQKRLQACDYYLMLQNKSFLLLPKYHLAGSGKSCDKSF